MGRLHVGAISSSYVNWVLSLRMSGVVRLLFKRASDRKEALKDVYGPLIDELQQVVEGYDSARSLDADAYPYYNDEFHSIWGSTVPTDGLDEGDKRDVPPKLRKRLDRYSAALDGLQDLEERKREITNGMNYKAARDYKLLSLAAPVAFHASSPRQFKLDVIQAVSQLNRSRADEAISDWERSDDYDDFPEPYWSELRDEEIVNRRTGRTGRYLLLFHDQRRMYETIRQKAAALERDLEREMNRSVLEYALRMAYSESAATVRAIIQK